MLGTPSAVKLAAFAAAPDALKKTLEPLIDKGLDQLVHKVEALQGDAKVLAAALAPSLKAGLLDIGVDVHGPGSNGFASVLVGVRVIDGDKVDAALQRILSNIPAKDRSKIELDVAKVDGTSIHRGPADGLERGMRDLVGDDAKTFLAIRKDMLLVGIGGETATMAAMKDALKSGPKTCKVLEGEVAMRQLARVIEKKHEGIVDAAQKAFPTGTDDLVRYSITGGQAAEFRVSSSIRMIVFSTLAGQLR
jgi:hypothetical protein